jgi:predicted adenylyl cyclase CyaB
LLTAAQPKMNMLVELKAKVEDLDAARRRLTSLGAQYKGTFRQTDLYFDIPQGRLKLRETDDNKQAELIYYERGNVAEPKTSNVFILKTQEPAILKTLLSRLLKTKQTVKKVREIYQIQENHHTSKHRHVQIHLDNVEKLGTFIEFEMKSTKRTENKDKQLLQNLMNRLEIKTKQLKKISYSDMLQ